MTAFMIPRRVRGSAAPALRSVRPLDRLFDDIWQGFDLQPAWPANARFAPRIDVREDDEAIVVSAELPGLEEKDFQISLEDEVLTLKGEKRSHSEEERAGYRHVESVSGAFERRLVLSAPVDADAIKAVYKNGVLSITLPKPPQARPQTRTIPISTS